MLENLNENPTPQNSAAEESIIVLDQPATPSPLKNPLSFELEDALILRLRQSLPLKLGFKRNTPLPLNLRRSLERKAEGLIQKVARETIEKAVRDMLPALAEKIIREEIQRLTE